MIDQQKQKTIDILIVDDDPGLQNLLSEILKSEELTFDVAKTGKEAFGLAMKNLYRLVLMDIKMPEWDGITAIRSLDFVQKIQKIIVISAYLDSATLQELNNESLVVAWLEKPFDPDELIKIIHQILNK